MNIGSLSGPLSQGTPSWFCFQLSIATLIYVCQNMFKGIVFCQITCILLLNKMIDTLLANFRPRGLIVTSIFYFTKWLQRSFRVRCKSLVPNRCRIDKLLTVNSLVAAPPCVTQVVFTCQSDAVNCMLI